MMRLMDTPPLTQNPLAALFKAGMVENYDKSELIIFPGQADEHIFMIKSGYLKSYTIEKSGRYQLLSIHTTNDLFPLHSLFNDFESDIFYEAMTPVVLFKIGKERFYRALATHPKLSLMLLRKTLSTIKSYNERLENLELGEARQRIIYRLIFLARRYGLPGKGKQIVIPVPTNYQDLADSINMARETVNREVRKLIKQGLVRKSKNYLVVLDKNSLMAELNT